MSNNRGSEPIEINPKKQRKRFNGLKRARGRGSHGRGQFGGVHQPFPLNSLMMSSEDSIISHLSANYAPKAIHSSPLRLYNGKWFGNHWDYYYVRLGKTKPVIQFYKSLKDAEPEFSYDICQKCVVYTRDAFEFSVYVHLEKKEIVMKADTPMLCERWVHQIGKYCSIEKHKSPKRKMNKLMKERQEINQMAQGRPQVSTQAIPKNTSNIPPGSPMSPLTPTSPPEDFFNFMKDEEEPSQNDQTWTSRKLNKHSSKNNKSMRRKKLEFDITEYQKIIQASPYDLSVEHKDVSKWVSKDVLLWLSFIRVSYTKTAGKLYGRSFFESSIDGTVITDFFFKQKEHFSQIFSGLGIRNKDHQEILKIEVEHLEKFRYFDITRYIVERKVERMFMRHLPPSSPAKSVSGQFDSDKPHPKKTLEEERISKIGKSFPDFIMYCHHFYDYITLRRTIHYVLTKNEKIKTGGKVYKVKFILTENIHDWWIKQVRKFLGKPLVTLQNYMGLMEDIKFGMYHAALSIGPLQMEYVDNSLVLLRSVSSENVLLCVDVGVFSVKDIELFAGKLAREVLQWNRDYTYEQIKLFSKKKKRRRSVPQEEVEEKKSGNKRKSGSLKRKKSSGRLSSKQLNSPAQARRDYLEGLWSEKCDTALSANCQEFVEYIVEGILGMRLEFSRDIKNYLDVLKKDGHSEMVFSYSSDFGKNFFNSGKSEFNFELFFNSFLEKNESEKRESSGVGNSNIIKKSESPIKFTKHRQLDILMQEFLKIDEMFPLHYSSQYELLKGFDRAFWMKQMHYYKKFVNKREFNIHEGPFAPDVNGCPFNMKEYQKLKRNLKKSKKVNQNAQ